MKKMRIVISGGGTGGHIYPALAIARGIAAQWPQSSILYLGTAQGLEADIVPKAGLPFQTISVQGFSRPLGWRTVRSVGLAGRGFFQAIRALRRFRPDLVVGTGGYVCGPVVLAAWLLGIPAVIHEQNAMPGMTNRFLARFVAAICLTFPEAETYFPDRGKTYLTGLPVREEVARKGKKDGLAALDLKEDRLTVVITGGSRGARRINQAMAAAMPAFSGRPDLQFYHISGEKEYQATLEAYRASGVEVEKAGNLKVVPYLYGMENALAAADLIVGRAGASFLAEIMVRGIPAILVPYPHAAADHQTYNARSLADKGAAVVIPDGEFSGQRLTEVLTNLSSDSQRRELMAAACRSLGRENALDNIVQVIAQSLSGKAGNR